MPRTAKPKPAEAFQPFADDTAARNFGDLSFENGITRIALHGSLDLTRDRDGLDRARSLKALVDAIVAALESQDLAEVVAEETQSSKTVKNPFA